MPRNKAVATKPAEKSRKTKKVESVAESTAEVAETVTESVVEPQDAKPKTRFVPSKESITHEFDDLVSSIEEEILKLRESSKSKGIKFLRSMGKRIKLLKSHTLRVTKQRKTTNRKNNSNSGFLKPTKISKELAEFTGWNESELKSRVNVTKYVCQYIKDNNLQNPQDRRQIRVMDDPKLKKLLNYDPKKDKTPLTYYSLQKYLKHHFSKPEGEEEAPKEKVRKSRRH